MRQNLLRTIVLFLLCAANGLQAQTAAITLGWTNNFLTISHPGIPGGQLRTLWWEAFCRKGSTARDWHQTTIPHRTELISQQPDKIVLRTQVDPGVVVDQYLRVVKDGVEFECRFENTTTNQVDLEWFEPCFHVDEFTRLKQTNYFARCFIYTAKGREFLNQIPREEAALYHGGQVYVPPTINTNDVNPRPISVAKPTNGLIGAISSDDQWLFALAWEKTQHLFQGVVVCIHSDPHLGGLKPHERKAVRGKAYLMPNDPKALEKAYQHDFPHGSW